MKTAIDRADEEIFTDREPGKPAPVMRQTKVIDFLRALPLGPQTSRYRYLDRLHGAYECRTYDCHKSDWDGAPISGDQAELLVPNTITPPGYHQPGLSVKQRRPSAPAWLTRTVVDRFTGLLFSDERIPTIHCEGDPETSDWVENVLIPQTRWWSRWREARTIAGACGSVCVTVHAVAGKLTLQVHNPKHLQVMWRKNASYVPRAVLKSYIFEREEAELDKTGKPTGRAVTVRYLYRRIISEDQDVTFCPVNLSVDEPDFDWVVHDACDTQWGFFPGVWVRNLPDGDSADGAPDCLGAFETADAADRMLSQANRGTLANCDPTLVLSVDQMLLESGMVRKGSEHSLNVGPGGSASYMEMSGAGINAARALHGDLRRQFQDIARAELVDPEKMSGAAQSARAIELMFGPMLEKSGEHRGQFGEEGIVPLLGIAYRMASMLQTPRVDASGRRSVRELDMPPRRVVQEDGSVTRIARTIGEGGDFSLSWPRYFRPTAMDNQASLQIIGTAKTLGLVDTETAVKLAAPVLGIADVDAVLARLAAESAGRFDMPPGYQDDDPISRVDDEDEETEGSEDDDQD